VWLVLPDSNRQNHPAGRVQMNAGEGRFASNDSQRLLIFGYIVRASMGAAYVAIGKRGIFTGVGIGGDRGRDRLWNS
jgi:hypothetical protein